MKGLERKLLLGGLVLLLGCLAVLFACQENQLHAAPFYVSIGTENASEQIMPWEDKNGNYYVFLPGYADLSNAQIKLNTSTAVFLDGEKLADGMRCDGIQMDKAYELVVAKEEHIRRVTFVQSANIATMYIDTASGSMNYIHAEKGNEEQGKIRLYTADGELNYGGEIEAINGRGNATWEEYEKKPYSLKLKEEANLLEMGAAQKWILLANASDPSNMRNKIVYDFAGKVVSEYSPDSRWVDLYLNGEYVGLYLLCERNEIHAERVNISPETGCIVSLEWENRLISQNLPYVSVQSGQALRIHSSSEISEMQKAVVQNIFQTVENAILSENGVDSVAGKYWSDLIDLDSWVKKYLLEEIFASNDACFISQYFYFSDEQAGKVVAGPVWDYDKSMANDVHWQFTTPNAFYANRPYVRDDDYTPWFYTLYKDEVFYNQLTEVYWDEFLLPLTELVDEKIENYTAYIVQAAKMNQMRWNIEQDLGEEVENITNFLTERIEFLTSAWVEGKEYCRVHAKPGQNSFHAYYAIAPGECLTTLPTLPDNEYQNFLGWYYVDTDLPFDSTAPITKDTEIYAKWADSQQKKVGQIVKLMPLAVIACMGVGILVADIRRSRKGG